MEPVQKQGRTWSRKHVLPDHTYNQSRTNAITPMTFLFLESRITHMALANIQLPLATDSVVHITRSGQGVTLLYLSFIEPETTFKCLNEILLLLTLPALDVYFRNPTTGSLKMSICFIVDNGPSEQPACNLVQMCVARLPCC